MNKQKTIRKWFWVWDFEKEEQWLNEMAMSGWVLSSVGFCKYTFTACEPGEYTVRLEMHEHDEAYLAFMKEAGAEYVGRIVQWIYFRKRTEDGPFDLFSDIDSRIAHLEKIGKTLSGVGLGNLAIGLAVSMNSFASLGWINLLCATLLMYALGRTHGRIDEMKKVRQLHE